MILSQEALSYASKRNSLWLKMDSSRLSEKGSKCKSDTEEFVETR